MLTYGKYNSYDPPKQLVDGTTCGSTYCMRVRIPARKFWGGARTCDKADEWHLSIESARVTSSGIPARTNAGHSFLTNHGYSQRNELCIEPCSVVWHWLCAAVSSIACRSVYHCKGIYVLSLQLCTIKHGAPYRYLTSKNWARFAARNSKTTPLLS